MPKTEPSTRKTTPGKSRRKKTAPEKRLRRYRSSPPASVHDRIHRALTQKLFLVRRGDVELCNIGELSNVPSCEFVVLGSTGNVYTVRVGLEPSCSCPDHAKGNLCKHIIFILVKVMGLPSNSDLIYQRAWLSSELQHMFDVMATRRVGGCVMANTKVQATYAKLASGQPVEEDEGGDDSSKKRKSLDENADCPICFDEMVEASGAPLTYCRAACGANFHAACIQTWLQQGSTTCPNCRQPWEDGHGSRGKGIVNHEGYANLGELQGQDSERDDSTYNDWYGSPYGRNRKRRRW